MIHYKKLSEISMEEIVRLWNRGFEGYFVNITMTLSQFLTRAANEELSLEDSIAAYLDDQPVGIVVNGFRNLGGKRVAWNGGTGIVPEFRGKGIGKQLMERNLQLYVEKGVELATLEALSQNEQAIRLYTSMGYEIIDRLTFLQHLESLVSDMLQVSSQPKYAIQKGLPGEVRTLSFYRHLSAWQTQWSSLKDGESIRIFHENEAVGYALFKRVFDQEGKLSGISLYQCEVLPGRADAEEILKAALCEIYQPLEHPCKRMTMNLRTSHTQLINLLQNLGFTSVTEQVQMVHKLRPIAVESVHV